MDRDGRQAMATQLKARIDHPVDADIKEYVASTSMCRRDELFGDVGIPLNLHVSCSCCDICCKSCQCCFCEPNLNMFATFS